jgi:hypothetical protein
MVKRILAAIKAFRGQPHKVEHKVDVTVQFNARKGITGDDLRFLEGHLYDEIEKVLNG